MHPRRGIAAGIVVAFLAITFALTAPGCGSKKSATAPGVTSATATGVVSDANSGTPLAGVSVKTSLGGTTTTDAQGRFTLSIPANTQTRIDVTRNDYSLNQVALKLSSGETKSLTVGLIPAGTTSSVAVAAGGKVTDSGSGATLSLPADFVTTTGSVNVRVTGLDPTSSEVKALPGGLDALDANGNAVYLKPVSFAEYTVTDGSGNVLPYNTSASQGADIELPIPSSLRGQPGYQNGDPIECYVYDPNDGKWKTPVPGVVGPSSVNASIPAIKATIFHLSWYGGAPASSEIGCVEGTVTLNGSPVAGCDIEAFPGGTARTDANGHYQVQAAASSTVRVDASLLSGTSFRSAEGSASVGASGVCAHLDLSLGAETSGQYTVSGALSSIPSSAPGAPLVLFDLATITVEVGTAQTQVPVEGALVQVGTGGNWFTLIDGGSGTYALYTGQQSFALTAGATYTLRVDFTNNGSWDATSQLAMTGVAVVTAPLDGATVGASFTANWTDAGSGTGGYSPVYWGGCTSTTTSRPFVTTARTFVIGSGVTDPVSHLPNAPLPAGSYTLSVYTGNGPTYHSILTGTYLPNVTGTNVTGYFDALSFNHTIALTGTGAGPQLAAGRATGARQLPQARPTAQTRAEQQIRRVQEQLRRSMAAGRNLRAQR